MKPPLRVIPRATEEFNDSQFAEDLELLADSRLDVFVLRVQADQRFRVGINFGERKFAFAHPAHDVQHVQSPSARLEVSFFERAESCIFFPHGIGARRYAIADYGNSRIRRNVCQGDVAKRVPAPLREGLNGFLLMMHESEKTNCGMRIKLRTAHFVGS